MTATVKERRGDAGSFSFSSATGAAVVRAEPFDLAAAIGALSRRAIESLTRAEAEALVVACERVVAAVHARQSLAVETLCARVEEDLAAEHDEPADAGRAAGSSVRAVSVDPHGVVASMLAPALHVSTRTVHERVLADRRLVCRLEDTFAAHWDGDLERHRADVLVAAGHGLGGDLVTRYESTVLETSLDYDTGVLTTVSERVRGLSRASLRRRANAVASSLTPDTEREMARRAQAARRVVVRPHRDQPGVARWEVDLPTGTSQRVFSAVDSLAARYARSAPGTPMDQHRADALSDLVLGNAEVRTVVELVVPVLPARVVATATAEGAAVKPSGLHGEAARVTASEGYLVSWVLPGLVDDPRHGCLAPEAIAELLSRPDITVRLARLDPDGSIAQDPKAYSPSASTRRRVRARDGHCRFPGCHTPAARCDLDHVVPFPRGSTSPDNLVCLCRTHHLFKHHGGWGVSLAADGEARWRAPDGREWTTDPRPHALRDALRLTEGLDPEVAFQVRRGWFPGLPPGLSLADLVEQEAQLPPDDPAEAYLCGLSLVERWIAQLVAV